MHDHYTVRRQAAECVYIRFASKESINVIEKIELHVSIGDSSTKAAFNIVDKIAINILLGTSIIDENILGILPQSNEVVPCDSKTVSILASETTDGDVSTAVGAASKARSVTMTATKTQVEMHVATSTTKKLWDSQSCIK